MDRVKLYLVRRWLHLMPINELGQRYNDRFMFDQMNKAYKKLSDAMVKQFFEKDGR